MLYVKNDESEAAQENPRRGTAEEHDRREAKGRRAGGAGENRGARESVGRLLFARGSKAGNREATEKIIRMERDRKLRQQQPIPNPAFLIGGTHGY
jgi:hypothetical protein